MGDLSSESNAKPIANDILRTFDFVTFGLTGIWVNGTTV